MHPNAMTKLLNLMVIALLITVAASDTPATAYTNHTVGGDAGWLFDAKTNKSTTNYTSWAANQTFNLGDYLIFNTNTNQSVIQTYNETTFRSCSIDDASDNDTSHFNGGETEFGKSLTIAVPLTITGPNYFFSDADDGVQCQTGMAFEISVNRGLGLPPSLNHPPPPPYIEQPGPDNAQPPPVTIAGGSPALENGALRSSANVRFLLPLLLCGFASFLA
ncbi:hypothetical protein ACOSP7_001136 [Xanthoceras sorbifolium]|uniref:Phytocyanin domain-containing protein n=1 Tax=Xanthoceras sorbifolium TaxID=99658 RepID=A0ABQ8IM85_9ROSI|nr:hypothetical protein JRO89_XS01G0303000 [Xanthoceras sorbifolium]